MNHGDLWAVLAGDPGAFQFEMLDGCLVHVDVRDRHAFEVLCRSGGRVCLRTFVENPWLDGSRRVQARWVAAHSNVLYVVASTPAVREAVEHFAPAPTAVVSFGAEWTCLWALERSLTPGWTETLNRRLALKVGAKLSDGGDGRDMAVPGTTVGRRTAEVVSWTAELHSARAVAGGLADPVDHKAAWKARQEAA